MTLTTKFTETFGVEHPIVQGVACSGSAGPNSLSP
jgi:hypothetical protein